MALIRKIRTLFRVWDTKRIIRNIKFIIKHDIKQDIEKEIYKIIDSSVEQSAFEVDELRSELFPLRPHVLSASESLSILGEHPKSFARFGDGEIAIMQGHGIPFQKYDPVLAEKLRKVLKTKRDDLYVGIGDYFHAPAFNALEFNRRFHRLNITNLRRFIMREANPELQYLHASCLMSYVARKYDYETCGKIMLQKKKFFENKKIAVVAGKGIFSKLDYDIFELASEKISVNAPSKDAFREYSSILDNVVRNVGKEYLVCIILGPTATVMASDLTDMGYLAWDVGHIAKDYDAYMKMVEHTSEMLGEFWKPD